MGAHKQLNNKRNTLRFQWQPLAAYLFEPSAHQAVRHAHEDLLNGDQHHAFVPSDAKSSVEDCDKTIPSGTQVVVRPRFPRVSFGRATKLTTISALSFLGAPGTQPRLYGSPLGAEQREAVGTRAFELPEQRFRIAKKAQDCWRRAGRTNGCLLEPLELFLSC